MTTTPPAGLAELLTLPLWVNADDQKVPYTPSLPDEGEGEGGRKRDLGAAGDRARGRRGGTLPACRAPVRGRVRPLVHRRRPLPRRRDRADVPRVRALVMLTNSYAEPSVGGTSVHIIVKGPLPRRMVAEGRLGKKKGDFEAYGGARYLRMSLQPFPGFDQVREIDQLTADLAYGLMFGDEPSPAVESQQRPAPIPIDLDDTALLDKAFASEGGEEFRRRHEGVLVLGNTSDDDFGYLSTLRFWTQADPARMRRVALASARVRDKWFSKRGAVDWLDYNIARINDQGGPVYESSAR